MTHCMYIYIHTCYNAYVGVSNIQRLRTIGCLSQGSTWPWLPRWESSWWIPRGFLAVKDLHWGEFSAKSPTIAGWWFGCHFLNFPINIGNNHPNWLSYFSEGWPNHQPDWFSENCFGRVSGSHPGLPLKKLRKSGDKKRLKNRPQRDVNIRWVPGFWPGPHVVVAHDARR